MKKAATNSTAANLEGPSFAIEAQAIDLGDLPVAGIDEAGRGPWAGPVVAAAVVLVPQSIPKGLDDSKALSARQRENLLEEITASGAAIGIGVADVDRIDRMNILQASLWAMAQAVGRLPIAPRLALVDGNRLPRLSCRARAIVGGDATCLSIAAASIVAKVTRDRMMTELAAAHPGYGFEKHKGYGTPEHKAALLRLGVCPQHRRSFRPVQEALGLDRQTLKSTR
jgi:ribonuclease HII